MSDNSSLSDRNVRKVFKPHEDITAYELARCMIVFLALEKDGSDAAQDELDNMPDACKRHWYTEAIVPQRSPKSRSVRRILHTD